MRLTLAAFASLCALLAALPARSAEVDWSKVDAAIGASPAVSGQVH